MARASDRERVWSAKSILSTVVCLSLTTAATGCWISDSTSPPAEHTFEIGALVSLSGPNSGAAHLHLAAMELAIEDANQDLELQGHRARLSLGDTQSDPLAASVLMNTFLLRANRITVGPYTSEEVAGVAAAIGSSHGLLISPSSTSMALANRRDHIVRFAPNDSHMVENLAALISDRGHRRLVLIYREDTWGRSVAQEMESLFESIGGTIVSSYGYDSSDPATVESLLEDVRDDIVAEAANHPASEIAIQLTSMGEGATFLSVAADQIPELGEYAWYGSDGYVRNWNVFETPQRTEFAAQVEFTAPVYRVEIPEHYWCVVDRIEERTGFTPGAYSLLSYDATMVAAFTIARAGPQAGYDDLRHALEDVVAEYQGVSGWIDLDPMGDRDGGIYDFYAVQWNGWTYDWVRIGSRGRRTLPSSDDHE